MMAIVDCCTVLSLLLHLLTAIDFLVIRSFIVIVVVCCQLVNGCLPCMVMVSRLDLNAAENLQR